MAVRLEGGGLTGETRRHREGERVEWGIEAGVAG